MQIHDGVKKFTQAQSFAQYSTYVVGKFPLIGNSRGARQPNTRQGDTPVSNRASPQKSWGGTSHLTTGPNLFVNGAVAAGGHLGF